MITQEQIVATLKKSGPVSPGALADLMEVEATALRYHLKNMLEAGTLKATGTTASRRVGLPDQKFDEAGTPQPSPSKTRGAPRRKKRRQAHRARRREKSNAAVASIAERFIPTVDVDKRLHIINGGAPVSFNEEQTAAIATLLFAHYEA